MRARIAAVLIVFFVLPAALGGCSSTPDDQVRGRLIDAERLLKRNRVREADSAIDKAIRSDPSLASTYEAATDLYRSEKLWGRAEAVAKELVKRAESDRLNEPPGTEDVARFYLILAEAQQNAGNLHDSEINYKKALALAPDSAELLNALGYFYADEGTKLGEALKLTERAVELAPNAGHIVDSLGWAQYKLGQYEKAVQTLRKAVELVPDSAELRYHLGAAYSKLGRKAEARVELEKALTLKPQLRESAELLKTLQK